METGGAGVAAGGRHRQGGRTSWASMGGDGGEKQTDVTNGGDDGRNGGADGAVGVADGGMFLQNSQARWGEGGRLNANCSQICPAPLDGNPVVSVGVSKVCTDTLVSIGYGALDQRYQIAPKHVQRPSD